MRGRRGPGLVGMAARTAVVAGTATAVSGRVGRRQQRKYADQDAQYSEQQGAAYEQGAQEVAGAQAPAPAEDDTAQQIRELAALKDQGLLTEDEFAAKKKQILGI
jgi:Short C-terminal domain